MEALGPQNVEEMMREADHQDEWFGADGGEPEGDLASGGPQANQDPYAPIHKPLGLGLILK